MMLLEECLQNLEKKEIEFNFEEFERGEEMKKKLIKYFTERKPYEN
jgi:hypothetical protein